MAPRTTPRLSAFPQPNRGFTFCASPPTNKLMMTEIWLWFSQAVDVVLHLDVHLAAWAQALGLWTYALLFSIIFAETGFVVTPFLPGDSLLFAAGALSSLDNQPVQFWPLWGALVLAAVAGDNLNYWVGHWVGRKYQSAQGLRWVKPEYYEKTEAFYRRFGRNMVIFARFLPILRTFSPFFSGVVRMNYRIYLSYSIVGAILWISACLGAGHAFGNIESVKRNFHYVIFGIILVSLLPFMLSVIKRKASVKSDSTVQPRA